MTTNRLAVVPHLERSPTDPKECCEWANARLSPKAVEAGLHWVTTSDPKKPIALVPIMPSYSQPAKGPVMDRRGQPMSQDDTDELNSTLEKLNATARYRSDGSRYMIDASG